jgi:hypothetical protein
MFSLQFLVLSELMTVSVHECRRVLGGGGRGFCGMAARAKVGVRDAAVDGMG